MGLTSCRSIVAALLFVPAVAVSAQAAKSTQNQQESNRKLEEVVVYGQRVEATVSDTSVAITALDQKFVEQMGLEGPDDMLNFIPAATRTAWDIKIRGVGRNFRGLGGDPGVGTYYNGVYSPDFGIASTEGALYDVKRIEVLRGPQGTLYGRNSIGGVVNYVTNQPNPDEFQAQAKVIGGRYNTREFYGFVTGPVTNNLAYRLVASKRMRDPWIPGLDSESLGSVNDEDVALTLEWQATNSVKVNIRGNYRHSHNNGNFGSGGHGIVSEGPCVGQPPITDISQCDPRYRVPRDTNYYAPGFRPVSQTYYNTYGDLADSPQGAVAFIHPVTGQVVYGAYNRPGVDATDKFPYMPSANYHSASVAKYNIGGPDAPDVVALTNNHDRENFNNPYVTLTLDWNINSTLAIKYLYNYQTFDYGFNRDNDFSNSLVSDNNDTDLESVDSFSHELRLFWQVGERWNATSGLYYFREHRRQLYGIRERAAQGRVSNPTAYGPAAAPNLLLEALSMVGWIMPPCMTYKDVPINAGPSVNPGYGAYCGNEAGTVEYSKDNDNDAVYVQDNFVESENIAFYTQGDLKITDRFRVTLGVRYSKDKRKGLEQRGGYSELAASDYSTWLPQAIDLAVIALHPSLYATVDQGKLGSWITGASPDPSITALAAMNVAMGNATWSGNPDFPITPVCSLDAVTCAHPLRLEGIPISFGSRINGTYNPSAKTTWRVNFNFDLADNVLLYFGVTTGYRAGGWDLGGTDNRILLNTDGVGVCDNSAGGDTSGCDAAALLNYGPETLTSYEIGYKGTHLYDRLQVNMDLYYYDYKNYQDAVEHWESTSGSFSLPNVTLPGGGALGAPPGRGPVLVTINIPKVVNKGFEADAVYLLTDSLTLGGNFSYTLAKYETPYTFFNQDDPRYPRSVFGGNLSQNPCDMSADIRALYCLQIDGYELQGIPKTKATFWADYTWFLPGGNLTWTANYAYTGKYSTNAFNRPWDWVPARDRVDTRLTYRDRGGNWSVSLFVDNVLDKTYIRTSDMDVRLTGYGSNWPQRVVALYPRYYGLEFVYSFGTGG